MASRVYPIALDLTGRPCLVVGGGPVAERKVRGLLEASADVTIVSPRLTETLSGWVTAERVTHVAREYRAGDLAGHQLAFVATDAPFVSAMVAAEARMRRVWLNAADDPEHCDFHLPAVVRRGNLVVAIASGGTSPALTRLVRDELEDGLPEAYALLAEVAGLVRSELRAEGRRADGHAWMTALRGEVWRLVSDGRRDDACVALRRALENAACR
jgi:precorrin-2 dehydrogenase